MIIRSRPSALSLFFILRGSIVPKVMPQILASMIVAAVVGYFHGPILRHHLTFTPIPFTIIGLALSIFLGFRNSVAYDRYWEARRLWGELLIVSRVLARQVFSLFKTGPHDQEALADLRRRMIHQTIAFAHALRHHLRGGDPREDLEPLLDEAVLAAVLASRNRPAAIVRELGANFQTSMQRGWIEAPLAANLDDTLNALDRILGGCERIKSTPIPFSYTLLLHRTAYLYCFLLPFGLIDSVGRLTPIVVGLVSYTFFGLDTLGDEIEEPFGLAPNDLALAAMSRGIEIDLREAAGEKDLPAPLMPQDYCLM